MPTIISKKSMKPEAMSDFALSLNVQWGEGFDGLAEKPVSTAQCRRWVKAAMACDAEITLRFVDKDEGQALNKQFREKDYATNVLTFPLYGDEVTLPEGVTLPCIADIVICWQVGEEEAESQKKPLKNHLAHLVIHGCLHAQGHDHETDEEAEIMESLEVALLRRFKISDPYQG